MQQISLTERAKLWKKEAEEFTEKLKQMDIEDEKKLSKIKKIMDDCNDGTNNSVFTLLYNMNYLFTGENSISQEQYENMLLVLTEKQLEHMQNYLDKDKEYLKSIEKGNVTNSELHNASEKLKELSDDTDEPSDDNDWKRSKPV